MHVTDSAYPVCRRESINGKGRDECCDSAEGQCGGCTSQPPGLLDAIFQSRTNCSPLRFPSLGFFPMRNACVVSRGRRTDPISLCRTPRNEPRKLRAASIFPSLTTTLNHRETPPATSSGLVPSLQLKEHPKRCQEQRVCIAQRAVASSILLLVPPLACDRYETPLRESAVRNWP